MKRVLTHILGTCILFAVWGLAERHLSKKYLYVDVERLLANQRTLNNYIRCILGKGRCTPEGRDLKENIPMALKTACVNCSDLQKIVVRKSAKHIIKHRPEEWEQILNKYDPSRENYQSFSSFLYAQ